ncbi:DUF948 domain-containing protein [Virgibacillus dokdonensis]|uniref:DUF948 domain-containing protein n=1 Tax=Virgibacillus dokdonensis TaxID=302167 RepID=UPI00098A3461|nr:DUF948 domain-containing protein [Virgibacillus dokdonensis]
MDWLGLGVTILGVAFLILAILLMKPLFHLAGVLRSLQTTTDKLPEQVEEITNQATDTISTGHETLHELNKQVKELTPIFHLVGDASKAAKATSSTVVDAIMKVQGSSTEGNGFTKKHHLEGIYGLATLTYYAIKQSKPQQASNNSK